MVEPPWPLAVRRLACWRLLVTLVTLIPRAFLACAQSVKVKRTSSLDVHFGQTGWSAQKAKGKAYTVHQRAVLLPFSLGCFVMALARGVTRMWSTAFERVGTHERRQILRRGFRLPTHAAWRARARAASSKADVKDYGLELPSFGSEDIEKARTCFDGSGERKVEWYPADAHPIAQATDELETRLGEDTVADRETLRWFVKERKLDVNAAEAKVGWALLSALAKQVGCE